MPKLRLEREIAIYLIPVRQLRGSAFTDYVLGDDRWADSQAWKGQNSSAK